MHKCFVLLINIQMAWLREWSWMFTLTDCLIIHIVLYVWIQLEMNKKIEQRASRPYPLIG